MSNIIIAGGSNPEVAVGAASVTFSTTLVEGVQYQLTSTTAAWFMIAAAPDGGRAHLRQHVPSRPNFPVLVMGNATANKLAIIKDAAGGFCVAHADGIMSDDCKPPTTEELRAGCDTIQGDMAKLPADVRCARRLRSPPRPTARLSGAHVRAAREASGPTRSATHITGRLRRSPTNHPRRQRRSFVPRPPR